MKNSATFSINIDGVYHSWEVETLWDFAKNLKTVEWQIPNHFKDTWAWGQSHPAQHIQRCLNADLSYPILVWQNIIIDGCHRTVKTLAKGEHTIKAKIITEMPKQKHQAKPKPEDSNHNVHWTYNDIILIIQAITKTQNTHH